MSAKVILGIAVLIIIFALSATIAHFIRKYARKLKLIDVPNERSSHDIPKPRGGGMAFVISFLLGLVILFYMHLITYQLLSAFVGGGFLVAFVSFLDDRGHVPASLRLLIHTIAAVWVLWVFHGMPALTLGFFTWHWHKLGTIVGVIGLVWLINLYNFMDGIDGLAASEAVVISLLASVLLFLSGDQMLIWVLLLLAFSVTGFLIWNWSPAKLFMGDSGSTFLGYTFGVLLVSSGSYNSENVWQWLILLGVFWVDATVTLIRRMRHGDKLSTPHKTHAFQIAATRWDSHKIVVLAVMLINVLWLFPMCLLIEYYNNLNLIITALAIIPLFIFWFYLNRLHFFKETE